MKALKIQNKNLLNMKMVVNPIRAPKVPFNFHYKIVMKKAIFAYFNFESKLKIEKRHFFFNFQFSIFIWKLKIKIFDFRFSIFILFQNTKLGALYNPCTESIILFSNSIEIENGQFHVFLSSILTWISKIELIFKFLNKMKT